ncbi:hypothetical protein EYC80_000164 [Monilinia laxa]|uniref:Uncharacterized protein n=1 Tax=Monilinia laxa TaxID=61186 RepID=A0A5N6K9X5_MONLA|nr:hypothetical protein EYC80_000164 [Monilinia laxa]
MGYSLYCLETELPLIPSTPFITSTPFKPSDHHPPSFLLRFYFSPQETFTTPHQSKVIIVALLCEQYSRSSNRPSEQHISIKRV